MPSFVYFNMSALRDSLNNLVQINKTIDFKCDDSIEEDIKILNLAVDCIQEYQEFILKIVSEASEGGDIETTTIDGLKSLIVTCKGNPEDF